MTNEERREQTKIALRKALLFLECEELNPRLSTERALDQVRMSCAALEALQRSQAGVPEPKQGV